MDEQDAAAVVADAAMSISAPVPKVTAAVATGLATLGINSWGDAAAALAFIYSLCVLTEWWWKRFWRPLLERRGWLKYKRQRRVDGSIS